MLPYAARIKCGGFTVQALLFLQIRKNGSAVDNGITSSNFFRKKDAHAAQTGTVVNITNKYGTLFSLSLLRKNPPLLHLKTNEKQKNIYAYFYSDLGIGKQPIENRNQ